MFLYITPLSPCARRKLLPARDETNGEAFSSGLCAVPTSKYWISPKPGRTIHRSPSDSSGRTPSIKGPRQGLGESQTNGKPFWGNGIPIRRGSRDHRASTRRAGESWPGGRIPQWSSSSSLPENGCPTLFDPGSFGPESTCLTRSKREQKGSFFAFGQREPDLLRRQHADQQAPASAAKPFDQCGGTLS